MGGPRCQSALGEARCTQTVLTPSLSLGSGRGNERWPTKATKQNTATMNTQPHPSATPTTKPLPGAPEEAARELAHNQRRGLVIRRPMPMVLWKGGGK